MTRRAQWDRKLKHAALLLRRSRLLVWSQQAGNRRSGKNKVPK